LYKHFPSEELQNFLGDGFILIVEPRPNYRTSIKQFLTNIKATRMKMVSSVEEARREMLTLKVGLFIVEWSLDGTNGIQFCRELRNEEIYKTTPFLLLSVENLKQDIVLASEVHIDGYLLKPFSYEDFCNQMLAILRNATAPNRANTLIQLAEERYERGDLKGALKIYDEVRKLNTSSARALCGMAKIADARKNIPKAVELLREATTVNPDYIEAYKELLKISEREKDYATVIEAAMYLNSLSPENPKYTLILARTHLLMKSLEYSEDYFRKTIGLSPKLAEAYRGLGNVYMLQEEYEKAMKNFKKSLDLDHDDISTLNSFGLALIRMGQFQEGIQKYLLAIKIDPHNAQVLFNIGQAYEKQKLFDKAKWYYSQAVAHQPDYEKAERALERVLDKCKNPKSA
jgi:tetratricopeptide (TPR) repeat protein